MARTIARATDKNRFARSRGLALPPVRVLAPVSAAARRNRLLDMLRRYLFTASGLVVIVALGVHFGLFTTPVGGVPLVERLAYGLPALHDGRWWTVLTGAPFAITPLCYVAVLASFAAFVGLAEHRMGTARAAAVWVIGHIGGVIGAIVLVAVTGGPLASAVDVGPSGGAMAAAAVVTATFPSRPRFWARAGLVAYVVGSLLVIGNLADVVHLVAVAIALPLGPLFVRRAGGSTDSGQAEVLLETHGGGTISWMTTWPGVEYLYGEDGYVAYRRHAGVAIAIGDPVGSTSWRREAPAVFAAHCDREGLVPAWFSVGDETAEGMRRGCRSPRTPSSTCQGSSSAARSGRTSAPPATARPRTASRSAWSPSPTRTRRSSGRCVRSRRAG